MEHIDERELIERARKEPEAFGELYSRYHGPIFGYVLKRVGDVRLAEDIASETFMAAYEKLWTFRWRGVPFSAWLYRIAGNAVAMHFRGSRRVTVSLDLLIETSGAEPVDPRDLEEELLAAEDALGHAVDFLRAQRVLKELPMRYQEVLALRYMEEKSLSEVAAILGKPLGTVKSLLSRGTEKLRQALETQTLQPNGDGRIVEAEGTTLTS